MVIHSPLEFMTELGNIIRVVRIVQIGNNHKVLNKLVLSDFTLYQLRHQFSTDLLSAGAPINVVRDLMGHESATMSLDYAVSNEKDRISVINNRQFS